MIDISRPLHHTFWSLYRAFSLLVFGTLIVAASLGGSTTPVAAANITVKDAAILVDGAPFIPRGASGRTKLAELKGLGANTVRTYGEEGDEVIAEAEHLGLKVILGFWLEHPRRGFDYNNRAMVDTQLARLRDFVLRHKDSPALLMWGIGNEVEAELPDDSVVWPAIEEAARLVKSLDPHHPTMAVLAEAGNDKVRKIMTRAPHIDVLGVNSYGDALLTITDRVRSQGWTGPLVITEMGAAGQWQAGKSPWGAALEPTSTEKAAKLRQYLAAANAKSSGQIVFLWGQKQEVTPTWHSLLLADGTWTEASEAMAEAWGGATPGRNHAPRIQSLTLKSTVWPQAATGAATIAARDPDGDALTFDWRILQESTDLGKAGDAESVPPDRSAALKQSGGTSVEIGGLPAGNYRLFVVVRDNRGAAATGNLPFQVK
jgi:hypothetical protein